MLTKRNIIISAVIIGILALSSGIYFAWQKSKQALIEEFPLETTSNVTSTIIGGNQRDNQIELSEKSIKLLSKNKVLDYWIFTSNSTSTSAAKNVFYISTDGDIWAINKNEQLINNIEAKDIQSLKASSNGDMVVIKSGTFDFPRFDILDVRTNIWQPALIGVSAVTWSPEGKKLAYFQNNGKGSFDLMIKDFSDSKSKLQKIISLNQTDFDLDWYGINNILLIPKPSINYISDIWNIDIKAQTVFKITSGNSLMVKWLKFGNLGLKFSSNSGRNYSFSLIDNNDNLRGSFKFNTMPNKCLISSPIQIYCAIPRDQNLFLNFNFPDDYFKKNIYTKDGIYAVDLQKNQVMALFESDDLAIDSVNLAVMDNQLLFINRYDNKLYSLGL